MIERQIRLFSGGGAALAGYDGLLRFGYSPNRGIYALRVTAADAWEGMTLRAFWHLPDGSCPPSSLVEEGLALLRSGKLRHRGRHPARTGHPGLAGPSGPAAAGGAVRGVPRRDRPPG